MFLIDLICYLFPSFKIRKEDISQLEKSSKDLIQNCDDILSVFNTEPSMSTFTREDIERRREDRIYIDRICESQRHALETSKNPIPWRGKPKNKVRKDIVQHLQISEEEHRCSFCGDIICKDETYWYCECGVCMHLECSKANDFKCCRYGCSLTT